MVDEYNSSPPHRQKGGPKPENESYKRCHMFEWGESRDGARQQNYRQSENPQRGRSRRHPLDYSEIASSSKKRRMSWRKKDGPRSIEQHTRRINPRNSREKYSDGANLLDE